MRPIHPNRRQVVAGLLASAAVIPVRTFAQEAEKLTAFDFDSLTETMRKSALAPYVPAEKFKPVLPGLDYDGYRNIRFDPQKARWNGGGSRFHLHAFMPGWLFEEPVEINEIAAGSVRPMTFSTDDFLYSNTIASQEPESTRLSGVAGFRLHHPLNRPDIFDELVSFLGASYFRALGRGNAYGLSARGLAIDTWREGPEEFPRFAAFWIDRPDDGSDTVTIHASLDSPSVAGAYQFIVQPGTDTVMDVTARLFFRDSVTELGIAPLTSMFLYARANRDAFDDYRPRVHDSEALYIRRRDGDVFLRPLNNPSRVAGSYFREDQLAAFGLLQRHRDFVDYQDDGARYHERPSVLIEPLDDWGAGHVRLVEIPAKLEAEDNIVAFWVPETPVEPGGAHEFRYRLHWGALPPDPGQRLAWVSETRAGHGGAAGVEQINPNLRKFVIDFEGGILADVPTADGLDPVVVVTGGTAQPPVLTPSAQGNGWRLVVDVDGAGSPVVEMAVHIAGFGRKLTETWLYQWVRDPEPVEGSDAESPSSERAAAAQP